MENTSAVVCPYNEDHIIHVDRLQQHLIKCSRNYPPNYKEPCPFNATHLMSASELDKHIPECPDRKYVEPEYYRLTLKNHGSIASCSEYKLDLKINHDDDENWDLSSINDDFSTIDHESVRRLPVSQTKKSTQAKIMRVPLTQSQVVMMDIQNEEAKAEDMESVTSSIGRGKIMRSRVFTPPVGRGRGILSQESLRVGASALTDTDDTESVVSSIGRGIVHYKMIHDLRYASDKEDTISVASSVGVKRTL